MPVRSDVEPILTVTTPASTYDLVTLATVKEELGVTGTAYDTRLMRWITSASQRCMNYTNRVFAIETVTEVWRFPLWRHPSPWLPASTQIIASRWPIQAFVLVVENANPPLTLGTDFEADMGSGQVWRLDQLGNRIHWNTQTVTLNYQGGYEPGDPHLADAELAATLLVKLRYAEQGARDPNLRQENIVGVVERQWYVPGAKESAMPAEVRDLLATYCEALV